MKSGVSILGIFVADTAYLAKRMPVVGETITGDSGKVIDSFTALYSPDLQAVLARRYDEGTSAQSEVGFETIKPLAE